MTFQKGYKHPAWKGGVKKDKEYQRQYNIEYMKKYYPLNKEKISERGKKYYRLNKERIAIVTKKYRQENREKIKERSKQYYQKNRDKCLNRYSSGWIYYFNKRNPNPKCEICEKELRYFSRQRGQKAQDSICVNFDHKKNGLPIKQCPSHWIRSHRPSIENIAIWEFCNFGVLCNRCNIMLPTENRKKWIEKATQYIFKH